MNCIDKIKLDIAESINKILKKDVIALSDFVYPPDSKMGDLSLPCFNFKNSLQLKKSPAEISKYLKDKLNMPAVQAIVSAGPYLNFNLNKAKIANAVIKEIISQGDKYGSSKIGKKQKVMVEFAHPNTHKAFHIGHLRTAITGESVSRILESLGFQIIRANYQGDVGPHVAKCIWGVQKLKDEYEAVSQDHISIEAKIKFLSKAYVLGSDNYDKDQNAKQEITNLNKEIYNQKEATKIIYENTRAWSLEYFDNIYKTLGIKFDRLYFESEVFEKGKELVLNYLEENSAPSRRVFKRSNGAIIFEGEKRGLHDRVFINSQGFPTYEAKELGLAKLQISEYNPTKIIHVVANEQEEYFKVLFCALGKIFPKTKDIEEHLSYAMVDLKNGKMSSRKGNVVLGEWLINQVREKIIKIGACNSENEEKISEKVSLGAVKYFILKNNTNKKILFDINESIKLSGNSGPYLQYAYVRIYSIINGVDKYSLAEKGETNLSLLKEQKEHNLIMQAAKYPEVVLKAGQNYDPSEIAKYLFELCKLFNDYYHAIPILKAEKEISKARLALIGAISQVIKNGLNLLGIETVDSM